MYDCPSVTRHKTGKKRGEQQATGVQERGGAGGVLTHSGSQVTHWRVEQGEDVLLQHQLHLLPVHSLLEGDTDARGRKKMKKNFKDKSGILKPMDVELIDT